MKGGGDYHATAWGRGITRREWSLEGVVGPICGLAAKGWVLTLGN